MFPLSTFIIPNRNNSYLLSVWTIGFFSKQTRQHLISYYLLKFNRSKADNVLPRYNIFQIPHVILFLCSVLYCLFFFFLLSPHNTSVLWPWTITNRQATATWSANLRADDPKMNNSPAGGEKVEQWEDGASIRAGLTPAMMKALRVRNALVRECMAEILGTFVLLVSEPVWIRLHHQGACF